jgi:hypothetical protein
MDPPTEPISSHDPRRRRQGNWHAGSEWRCLLQGAVRAVAVVMVGVLGQHRPQLPASQDQHRVPQLPPDGADPPLGDGIGVRAWIGVPMTSVPTTRQRSSKARVNLVSRIRNRSRPPQQASQGASGVLGDPCVGGVGGDAGEVHTPGVQLDAAQDLQPLQEHGLHGEEVRATVPAAAGVNPRG